MIWAKTKVAGIVLAVACAASGGSVLALKANKPQEVGPAVAADVRRSAKEDLTPKSFEKLHSLIKVKPAEWPWREMPWYTDLWAARKKAAAENKPILWHHTGGAGYNNSLGLC
jgi:hypothetical protein